MNILTIDTTFDKSYLTFSSKGNIVTSVVVESDKEKYHSAFLMSNIAKILKENSITMKDINAVATNIGPGSFTGIRVGLTATKIISHQMNIPAIGVTSSEIISKINNTTSPTLVLADARRGKFYAAIYNGDETILPVCAIEKEKMIELANKKHFILADKSVSNILNTENIKHTCYETSSHEFGEFLATIAYKKLTANKEDFSWYNLNPLYIQPPPITISKK